MRLQKGISDEQLFITVHKDKQLLSTHPKLHTT